MNLTLKSFVATAAPWLLAGALCTLGAPARAAELAQCPGAQAQLQEALVGVVQDQGLAGSAAVRLQVQGGRVVASEFSGAPAAYDRALRRALRGLHCGAGGGAERQTVSFSIRFVDPWGREEQGGRLVAVAR